MYDLGYKYLGFVYNMVVGNLYAVARYQLPMPGWGEGVHNVCQIYRGHLFFNFYLFYFKLSTTRLQTSCTKLNSIYPATQTTLSSALKLNFLYQVVKRGEDSYTNPNPKLNLGLVLGLMLVF